MNPAVDSGTEVRWSQVEDAFFVGNFRGNFVGYIDQVSPTEFQHYDDLSTKCGIATSLEEAMTSLTTRFFATGQNGRHNGS